MKLVHAGMSIPRQHSTWLAETFAVCRLLCV